jgi:hypothetical protein
MNPPPNVFAGSGQFMVWMTRPFRARPAGTSHSSFTPVA